VQDVTGLREDHPISPDPQSTATRKFSLQVLNISTAGSIELQQPVEYAHRQTLVEAADISARLGDQSIVGVAPVVFQREVVHGQAKIREDFFHRDPPPTVLFEPGFRFEDCLALFLAHRLILDGKSEHRPKKRYRRGNLFGL
jgi:hypothetical protein